MASGSTCNSSSICCHFFLSFAFRYHHYNTDSKDCLFDGIMVSLEYGILKNCHLFMKTGVFLNKVSSWIQRPILEILFSRLNQIYANLDPHVFKGRFHAGKKRLKGLFGLLSCPALGINLFTCNCFWQRTKTTLTYRYLCMLYT